MKENTEKYLDGLIRSLEIGMNDIQGALDEGRSSIRDLRRFYKKVVVKNRSMVGSKGLCDSETSSE